MYAKGLEKDYDPDFLYELSEEYGIDPGFVLAVFILETGWGYESLAYVEGNNPAGITCGKEYCTYSSPEEGMEEMYKLLKSYVDGSISYVGKRNTVREVREAWSEADDSEKVLEIWRSIYDKGRDKAY